MAAGDYRMHITRIIISPQQSVSVEYQYAVEDKTARTQSRIGDTLDLSWSDFVGIVTATERAALLSVRDKLRDKIKLDIPFLGGSLDLT